jgi:hypothetical protein
MIILEGQYFHGNHAIFILMIRIKRLSDIDVCFNDNELLT